MPDRINWDELIADVLQRGTDVPEVPWFKPGEDAAYDVSSADSLRWQLCLASNGQQLIQRRVQMCRLGWMQTGCFSSGWFTTALNQLC